MVVMGIDPSHQNAGWAVVDDNAGFPSLLCYGVVKGSIVKGDTAEDSRYRSYLDMGDTLLDIAEENAIDRVVVESMYAGNLGMNMMKSVEARAVFCAMIVDEYSLDIHHAMSVKKYFGIKSKGTQAKKDLTAKIREIFELEGKVEDHSIDAIALALSWIHSIGIN
jgi:Holliday junction resolvasome RuvABC endonuclease subunit